MPHLLQWTVVHMVICQSNISVKLFSLLVTSFHMWKQDSRLSAENRFVPVNFAFHLVDRLLSIAVHLYYLLLRKLIQSQRTPYIYLHPDQSILLHLISFVSIVEGRNEIIFFYFSLFCLLLKLPLRIFKKRQRNWDWHCAKNLQMQRCCRWFFRVVLARQLTR